MVANSPSDVVKTSHCVCDFKRSTVDKGYYEDNFIKYFSSPSDQSPSLHMWFYMRVTALRTLLSVFVESFPQEVQFVNLGAGLDTLSFYLLSKYKNVVCFDLDFKDHLLYKTELLTKSNGFEFLNYQVVDGLVKSNKYTMVAMDFEDLESVYKLEKFGLSRHLPTVFLSEFCLTYVQNDTSDQIGSWTAFGQWYSKLFEFIRYKELGWDHVMVNPMSFTYNELITEQERSRLKDLSKFDNFDYFAVLPNHTVIGAAVTQKEQLSRLIELYDMTNYVTKETSTLIPYDVGFRKDGLDVDYFKKMLHPFV
uniref:Leucine carboxyl methyltransferase 1 n=1 Tax=Theileria parva TaxID=5875 RepID=Q4N353_THEPA|eukprot:XP_763769.1 hypothetical protein [Theileria parva strain Muguga]